MTTDALFPAERRITGGHSGGATFSACPVCPLPHSDVDGTGTCQHCGTKAVYRYNLWRCWGNPMGRYVLWVLCNPSTANAYAFDPTLTRCKNYSQAWGYDGLVVRNWSPYRATDPNELKAAGYPQGYGDENLRWLARRSVDEPMPIQELGYIELTVVGWGFNVPTDERTDDVLRCLTNPHALAVTAAGAPRHPLYLSATLDPKPYPEGFTSDDID
jgi:hypothetical protein